MCCPSQSCDPWSHSINETNQHLQGKREAKRRYRLAIFLAFGHRCAYCGASATTLDHIKPRHHGGRNEMRNLAPACVTCNRDKASTPWLQWFRAQPFWTVDREADLWLWTHPPFLPA